MLNSPRNKLLQFAFFRRPISARRRRLDDNRLAFVDDGSVAPLQALHTPFLAPCPVLAGLARFATRKPKWPHAPVAGKDCAFHFFEESNGAPDAIAGMPLTASAGA